MKKHIPHKQLSRKNTPNPHVAKTGEHCPLNGWWAPASLEQDSLFIAQGSVMPADEAKSVTWRLVANEFRLRKPNSALPAVGASSDSY
jgi:hypothetical protein